MLSRFLARQLSRPGAIVGPLLLAPVWNRRNAALNDTALEALALHPEDRVLEVGFGGGYLIQQMSLKVPLGLVTGVDASPSMVAYVRRRERRLIGQGRLVLRLASAENLPFPDGSFRKICSVNSLFYWSDWIQAFAEMHRVATPSAQLVLCFTDQGSLAPRPFARHGLKLSSKDEIHQMLDGAGWQVDWAEPRSDRHRQYWCLTARRGPPGQPLHLS
jgi:ubiquinone/menaquinone biosynthesis C-methylase UbiE